MYLSGTNSVEEISLSDNSDIEEVEVEEAASSSSSSSDTDDDDLGGILPKNEDVVGGVENDEIDSSDDDLELDSGDDPDDVATKKVDVVFREEDSSDDELVS